MQNKLAPVWRLAPGQHRGSAQSRRNGVLLLARFLNRFIRVGSLSVIDSGGRVQRFGDGEPAVTIRVHDPSLGRKLFFEPELAIGNAYMDGTLTVEGAGLHEFLDLLGRNCALAGVQSYSPFGWLKRPLLRLSSLNSQRRARRNMAHHYDLNGALYDLFLDQDRHYSCAYFAGENDSLEQAQVQKCRHIAAKLLLKPGMRVLDIGSGWGGMALYLAEHCGAEVVGVTLSEEQLKMARRRAERVRAHRRARFLLRDYREEDGIYDRIVSVGMFEHVGLNQYETYFRVVRDRLADNGVALVHTIGHLDGPGPTSPWIRKYIFPGGSIPGLAEAVTAAERAGLLVTDVEVLRLHYAETLRRWRERFLANRDRARALYDERFCRMWEFYLAGSEMAFRYMSLGVFQIQLAKRIDAVPLTRDYMVDRERKLAGDVSGDQEMSAHRRSA
jgi:cyclopropane-fatty-acyl-phospholipid synthase